MDSRTAAVKILTQVVRERQAISAALPPGLERLGDQADRALTQELCFGVMRWWHRLDALAALMLPRKLKAKDLDVKCLIALGLYQLCYLRIPSHAVVSETVKVTGRLKKEWARGLVNAILRRFLREREKLFATLDAKAESAYSHPGWLLKRLRKDWPDSWKSIVEQNNLRPPMALRVNLAKISREEYLDELGRLELGAVISPLNPEGLIMDTPVEVDRLPGFADGWVSIQDVAAQQAGRLLALTEGQRVLDACAAPGGKTCHILELEPELKELVALDIEPRRAERIQENLARLHLKATVTVGDAGQTEAWWDGVPFDRILVDAPCSATGVIRRHPDIKFLREPHDVEAITQTQARLLDQLWPLVASGGTLLYATCSVLVEENCRQVEAFLRRHTDATENVIEADWGRSQRCGRQVLPGEDGLDGFYYACLQKA